MKSPLKGVFILIAIFQLNIYNISSQDVDWTQSAKENIYQNLRTLKYGLKSKNGEIAINAKYDYLKPESDSTLHARLNGKYGLLNHRGQVIIPLVFKKNLAENEGCYIATNFDDKIGLINLDGDTILPFEFDNLSIPFSTNPVLEFSKGTKKKGIINFENEIIIPPDYDYISVGRDMYVAERDNKDFIFLKSGKKLLADAFDSAERISQNLIIVKNNNKYGLLDIQNGMQLNVKYDRINHINRKYLSIEKNKKIGLYRLMDGTFILPMEYEKISISSRYKNFLLIKQNGKYGLVSKWSGKIVIPCMYDKIEGCNGGSVHVALGKEEGIVDTLNNTIIALQEVEIDDFFMNAAVIEPHKRDGFKVNLLTPDGLIFEEAQPTYKVLNHDAWKKNKPPYNKSKYTYVHDFMSTHFFVDGKITLSVEDRGDYAPENLNNVEYILLEVKDKWGLYAESKKRIDHQYEELKRYKMPRDIENLLIMAKKDGKYGTIDINENILVPFEYDALLWSEYGWILKKKEKYGYYLIEDRKITTPVEYDSIANVEKRLACWKDGKVGIINYYNEVIEPIKYDSIGIVKSGYPGGFYLKNEKGISFFDKSWNRISNEIYTDFNSIGKGEIELIKGHESTIVKWRDFVLSQYDK